MNSHFQKLYREARLGGLRFAFALLRVFAGCFVVCPLPPPLAGEVTAEELGSQSEDT